LSFIKLELLVCFPLDVVVYFHVPLEVLWGCSKVDLYMGSIIPPIRVPSNLTIPFEALNNNLEM
jgi:hypothetical protein